MSTLCFSSNSVTLRLKLDPWSRNTLGYLTTLSFLYIAFNTNAIFFSFLVIKGLGNLHLDVTSTPVNTYLYMFPSRHYGTHKAGQTVAGYWIFSHHIQGNLFLKVAIYKFAKGLVFLTMIWHSLLLLVWFYASL